MNPSRVAGTSIRFEGVKKSPSLSFRAIRCHPEPFACHPEPFACHSEPFPCHPEPFPCHSEPFAVILSPSLVILSPSLVILSGAKNLALPLRVNSARNLALVLVQ